ncbi:integral peroxisomal membrane peroxin-domain-containing protein [Tuber borchii]|uniref:Integral peroxisomal membrane peroxin-domain-containing protein n=1 Tax=Tuber borchii TaxID=42251 RepID=A0A2T7A475_TUBBO|nr:integral peroxisomal membrane peroxin-domain-containing protein [Tuber borchii]
MSDEPSIGAEPLTDLHPTPSTKDPNPPTFASFAPPSCSPAARSTFQVHQKSPLLAATPPRITRALSQAFPYLSGLNWVAGLLTWTTKDPWESFLVVAAFWAAVLYGDVGLRWAGNVVAVALLVLGMFLRRYRDEPAPTTLDEILETLSSLTTRLNIFFEPFLSLTRFLSTTVTATTTTTRPVLTTLFFRILITTPIWLFFAVYPFQVITTRRVALATGTLILSWHSRPAKVSRTILWRSSLIRAISSYITGLTLVPLPSPPPLPPRKARKSSMSNRDVNPATASSTSVNSLTASPPKRAPTLQIDPSKSTPLTASTAGASPGVKFTFAIYENQRRWLGVGWTSSLFAYERAPFTDEHLQPCPQPEEFALPETPAGSDVRWRWVEGEEWRVEGADGHGKKSKGQEVKDKLGGSGEVGQGWVYYDNQWRDGRRGVDGWGKYTRRRKWYRNAELVEDLGSDTSDSEGEGEVGAQEEEGATEATFSPLASGGDGNGKQRYRRTEHDEDEGDISTDEVPDVIVTLEEDGTGEEKEKYIMEKSVVSGNGVARPPLPPR